MQTINIHEVTSVKLGTVSTFAKSSNRKAFNVRTLEITDAYGNKIAIELFATDREFLTSASQTICWANVDCLPKNLHGGLKTTLNNQLIRAKIDTILVLENDSKNTK